MAELAEVDREKILGANYREIERAAQLASGVQDADRLRAERISSAESSKLNALAIVVVGALLLASNYFAVSGPSVVLVGLFGAALCASGVAWYWRLGTIVRRLQQEAAAK